MTRPPAASHPPRPSRRLWEESLPWEGEARFRQVRAESYLEPANFLRVWRSTVTPAPCRPVPLWGHLPQDGRAKLLTRGRFRADLGPAVGITPPCAARTRRRLRLRVRTARSDNAVRRAPWLLFALSCALCGIDPAHQLSMGRGASPLVGVEEVVRDDELREVHPKYIPLPRSIAVHCELVTVRKKTP